MKVHNLKKGAMWMNSCSRHIYHFIDYSIFVLFFVCTCMSLRERETELERERKLGEIAKSKMSEREGCRYDGAIVCRPSSVLQFDNDDSVKEKRKKDWYNKT